MLGWFKKTAWLNRRRMNTQQTGHVSWDLFWGNMHRRKTGWTRR